MKNYSKIIHIDMDAFFASVEQRDFPELQGKPIAVDGKKRGVVAAASYEARKYGVKSAMPSIQAEKLCPNLIFVKGRREEYIKTSKEIMSILSNYSELIEKVSIDEAYLDVTELINRQKLNTKDVALKIKNEIKSKVNLTASAGVSFNKFLAKVASDYKKPDGLFVIHPNKANKFVSELDVKKIPGVGKVTLNNLNSNNIFIGQDIIDTGKITMTLKFGKLGKYLYDIVTFNYNNPVKTTRVRKSIGTERTFENDISSIDEIENKIFLLSEKLSESMKKRDLRGKTITLKIKFHDFRQITRSYTTKVYVEDSKEIYKNALKLIAEADYPKQPIRLLGIQISKLNTEEIEIEQLKFEF